jgi:hypothetical protein
MFGDGMVSLGVAEVTIARSAWKSWPKMVCSRRTSPSILSAAEVNSMVPVGLRNWTFRCSGARETPPSR